MDVQVNRRPANWWLGMAMKHGLTVDDKSVRVGVMKCMYSTPDVLYMSVGLSGQRHWLNVSLSHRSVYAYADACCTLTLSCHSDWKLQAFGPNHIPLKLKISGTQGTSILLFFPLFASGQRAVSLDTWTPTGSYCLDEFFFSSWRNYELPRTPPTEEYIELWKKKIRDHCIFFLKSLSNRGYSTKYWFLSLS